MKIRREVQIDGRYGKWIVLHHLERRHNSEYYQCRCDCGTLKAIQGYSLATGGTHSCGCDRARRVAVGNTKHGENHTLRHGGPSREYRAWASARNRCINPKNNNYKDYGARGIRMCERWEDFAKFLEDMGRCPPGHSIDRYPDNNGNYEPGNCRWATDTQQNNNTRATRHFNYHGENLSFAQIARLNGISKTSLWGAVIGRGEDLQEVIRRLKEVTPPQLFEWKGEMRSMNAIAVFEGIKPGALWNRVHRTGDTLGKAVAHFKKPRPSPGANPTR